MLNHTRYTSEIPVRPDDIDLFNHVHSTRYIDYVLAARYIQMRDCYGMSMESFIDQGLGWVMADIECGFRYPMKLGDTAAVETWLIGIDRHSAHVGFSIASKQNGKIAMEGKARYVLVKLPSGRPTAITAEIISHYSLKE